MSTIPDRGNAATDIAAFVEFKQQFVAQSTRSICAGKIDREPLAMSR
jgi:hypothetical protein